MSVLKSIWWVESDYNIMAKRKGTKRQTVVYKTLCTEN